MTAVVSADFSDNNGEVDLAHIRQHAPGANLVLLKLYPHGGWTSRAFQRIKDDVEVIGFYAAEVTPSWPAARAALQDVGVDPQAHPIANDTIEFHHARLGGPGAVAESQAFVEAAHADGVKAALYVGRHWPLGYYPSIGQDWTWIPDYTGHDPGSDLWQYAGLVINKVPWGDLSRSRHSLEDMIRLTIGARGAGADRKLAPPKFPGRLLRFGGIGDDVTRWQSRMNERLSIDPEGPAWLAPDGIFGPKTDARTRAFQTLKKLRVDGVVGPESWNAAFA